MSSTLADLKPGNKARIEQIDTSDAAVVRRMSFGLVEGIEVEFISSSLGGDPLELRLCGSAISMRREQAKCFQDTVL